MREGCKVCEKKRDRDRERRRKINHSKEEKWTKNGKHFGLNWELKNKQEKEDIYIEKNCSDLFIETLCKII